MDKMSRASKKRQKNKLKDKVLQKKQKTHDGDHIPDEQYPLILNGGDNLLQNLSSLEQGTDQELLLENILSVNDYICNDSRQEASLALYSILKPTDCGSFYKEVWERKALCVNRESNAFVSLFSMKLFLGILSENALVYGTDITASKYNMELQMLSACGESGSRASERDLVRLFKDGHTLRLMVPQKYHDILWRFLALLEQEVECALQAHAVLSPSGQTEHPPRRVTANAFVLQLEGSSVWRLTRPPKEDSLPRTDPDSTESFVLSDDNFSAVSDHQLGEGEHEGDDIQLNRKTPIQRFEYTLNPGDSLYVPRGWLLQHSSSPSSSGEHSLHLFVFVHRTTSHADLLQMVLPVALTNYALQNVDSRRTVPRGLFSFCGVAHSEDDEQNPRRKALTEGLRVHLAGVAQVALDLVDAAVDQLAKQFVCERLPVPLTCAEERVCGGSGGAAGGAGHCVGVYSRLRMLRPGVARAVVEDGKVVVYHCMDNSREVFGAPVSNLEFELDDGPAIEALLQAYPEAVSVVELPHPSGDDEDKLAVARALFDEGFLAAVDAMSRVSEKEQEPEGEAEDEDNCPF